MAMAGRIGQPRGGQPYGLHAQALVAHFHAHVRLRGQRQSDGPMQDDCQVHITSLAKDRWQYLAKLSTHRQRIGLTTLSIFLLDESSRLRYNLAAVDCFHVSKILYSSVRET
jgi:hypothetical protein